MTFDAAVSDTAPLPLSPQQNHEEHLLRTFVGPNGDAYIDTYRTMYVLDPAMKKSVRTWCWPAFVLPLAWLMYRKMWLVAAVMLVAPVLVVVLFPSYSGSGGTVIAVLIAMRGKAWYLQLAVRRIRRIERENPSPDAVLAKIARAGGVSKVGAAFGTAVSLLGLAALVTATFKPTARGPLTGAKPAVVDPWAGAPAPPPTGAKPIVVDPWAKPPSPLGQSRQP
jgi:hypothetical protein